MLRKHSLSHAASSAGLTGVSDSSSRACLADSFIDREARVLFVNKALKRDLEALDERFKQVTADHSDTPLLTSQPLYDYFGRRYRLNLRSVTWEPDHIPVRSDWEKLDELLQEHPAKWMLWESQPARETVDQLRQRGIRSALFHPCANKLDDLDYLQTMRRNIESLTPIFRPSQDQ